jgi:phosphotransferase system  glucose/maltose/N-acetylglucosamine-specific IIC component
VIVFGLLKMVEGSYARIRSVTMSKQDPTTDPIVEMAKTRINAIGKVTKNSGEAIKEARLTFDALTEAQKELIYAPQLEKAEKRYAEIMANDTTDSDAAAVALVEIQISAIGEVTTGSGPAIQQAREAFDNLSKKLQKKVKNAKALTDAEAAYAALMANTGDTDKGGDMTLIIVIIVVVVLAAAGAAVAIILAKKKKNNVPCHSEGAVATEESVSSTEETQE